MNEEMDSRGNIYSAKDTLDINELASLNDDISTEFIEQLQNQIAKNASDFTGKPIFQENEDSTLFEENSQIEQNTEANISKNSNDDFAKKYQEKLNNKQSSIIEESIKSTQKEAKEILEQTTETSEQQLAINQQPNEIENLSNGNIIEKPASKDQIEYNESLDFIDNDVKYSKYVIYIAPENKEFIDSLTVKERKNLINRILREQDDIALTKRRLGLINTLIKHSVVAIITISLAVPIIYWTINASLEASINNYRRSQTIFKTLYKEKGKIKTQNKY